MFCIVGLWIRLYLWVFTCVFPLYSWYGCLGVRYQASSSCISTLVCSIPLKVKSLHLSSLTFQQRLMQLTTKSFPTDLDLQKLLECKIFKKSKKSWLQTYHKRSGQIRACRAYKRRSTKLTSWTFSLLTRVLKLQSKSRSVRDLWEYRLTSAYLFSSHTVMLIK